MYEQFKTWVKAQPADLAYDYMNVNQCPLAQFGRTLYPDKYVKAGGSYFNVYETPESNEPTLSIDVLAAASTASRALAACRTFGQLAGSLL